jgi:hypothetical protein
MTALVNPIGLIYPILHESCDFSHSDGLPKLAVTVAMTLSPLDNFGYKLVPRTYLSYSFTLAAE